MAVFCARRPISADDVIGRSFITVVNCGLSAADEDQVHCGTAPLLPCDGSHRSREVGVVGVGLTVTVSAAFDRRDQPPEHWRSRGRLGGLGSSHSHASKVTRFVT